MINKDYLKNLNDAQKEAVMHHDGPLLIVAGAGSGKTKVLTSRIADIIKEKRAFPNQILAVTFTNKAAKEMQNRVSKILGSSAVGLSWLGTNPNLSKSNLDPIKAANSIKQQAVPYKRGHKLLSLAQL